MKLSLFISCLLLFCFSKAQLYVSEGQLIKTDTVLYVNGNFTNNGDIRGLEYLELNQSNAQTIQGEGSIENLRINKSSNTAEVTDGNQSVWRHFSIQSGTFIPGERLTLKSNDTLTAVMIESNGGSITGNFIIEKYLPQSNRAFRYFASPVATTASVKYNLQEDQNNTGTSYPEDNVNDSIGYGLHITGSTSGTNGFDATLTGNPSGFTWSHTNFQWETFANTNVKTLSKGESYALLVRGNRSTALNSNSSLASATTLRLRGNPSLGAHQLTSTSSSTDDFFLIPNPYQSTTNLKQSLSTSTGLNTDFIYVYDPTLNAKGAYATVDMADNTNNNASSNASYFLQPWQSVFVQSAGTGSVQVDYVEADKDNSESQYVILSTPEKIIINLKSSTDQIVLDAAIIKLGQQNQQSYKLFNTDENLAVVINETLSAYAKLEALEGDSIPLFINNFRHTNYQVEIDLSSYYQQEIYLKDAYLNTITALSLGEINTYNLQIDQQIEESIAPNRLSLVFEPTSLGTSEFNTDSVRVYPNPFKSILNLKLEAHVKSVEVYNLNSRRIISKDINADYIDLSELSSGVYFIKLNTAEHSYFEKIIKLD